MEYTRECFEKIYDRYKGNVLKIGERFLVGDDYAFELVHRVFDQVAHDKKIFLSDEASKEYMIELTKEKLKEIIEEILNDTFKRHGKDQESGGAQTK